MSSTTGKHIRLNRLIEARTTTCLIVAIDHGMTSPRFLPGLFDTGARVQQAIAGGANVLMLGRGMAKAHAQHFRRDTALALMLTASAADRLLGRPQCLRAPVAPGNDGRDRPHLPRRLVGRSGAPGAAIGAPGERLRGGACRSWST